MQELPNAIATLRYYAGFADKLPGGQTIEVSCGPESLVLYSHKRLQMDETKFAYTRAEPIGVVGAIGPWNYPRTPYCVSMSGLLTI